MARAFWKGAISLGMVVIPVRMYTATEVKTPQLHYLHKKCLTKPRQLLYCEQDKEYFSVKETVRGFEYARGEYVVLEESDLKKVPVRTLHSIDVQGFVKAGEIDPLYYYGSHYLEPEPLGVKPFFLLREALVKTERVGVAKVAFQRREHLCCLRPLDGTMALHTMHFHDEVLPHEELAVSRQQVSGAEMDMAVSLVNAMARRFRADEFSDDYARALQKVIRAKLQGEELKAPRAPKARPMDLMSALKASVEAALKEAEDKERARAGARR